LLIAPIFREGKLILELLLQGRLEFVLKKVMLTCAGDIELGELASILIQHESLGRCELQHIGAVNGVSSYKRKGALPVNEPCPVAASDKADSLYENLRNHIDRIVDLGRSGLSLRER
jgi:hypothetical protein